MSVHLYHSLSPRFHSNLQLASAAFPSAPYSLSPKEKPEQSFQGVTQTMSLLGSKSSNQSKSHIFFAVTFKTLYHQNSTRFLLSFSDFIFFCSYSSLGYWWAADFYSGRDAMWLPKPGPRRGYSFHLAFLWVLAFGALSCHLRSLRLPYWEEAQVVWGGHMYVFWQTAPAEVPASSISHQLHEWRPYRKFLFPTTELPPCFWVFPAEAPVKIE